MTLALSIAALLLGPLLYAVARRWPLARKTLDILVILAIATIVLVHIIPEAWEQAGYLALAVLAIGAVFPIALERLFRRAHDTAHFAVVVLAGAGLILHAMVDGLALLPATGGSLAAAIVLHRIPVGMAIWWIVRPSLGVTVATMIFAAIIAATCAGYFYGETVIDLAESTSVSLLQAFVAGSLAHVAMFGITHRH